MDIRLLINEMARQIEAVNKSFSAKDIALNSANYAGFRNAVATLQTVGIKVKVVELWERGLVCVEVTLDKVVF